MNSTKLKDSHGSTPTLTSPKSTSLSKSPRTSSATASNQNEDLSPVYKKLARKIEQENDGSEGFWEEMEIEHHGRTYWITYTLRRTNMGKSFNYDEEPFGEVRTEVSISDYMVTDRNGNTVTSAFDPYEVEVLFDYEANRI